MEVISFDLNAASNALANLTTGAILDQHLAAVQMPSIGGKSGAKEPKARLLIGATGCIDNQTRFAGLLIDVTVCEGRELTPDMLRDVLVQAFPAAKVGDRHGFHMLSLARSGKLPLVREGAIIPKVERKQMAKSEESAETPVEVVEG